MIERPAILFSLVLARVSMFVMVLPLLGGPQTPRVVKVGLSLALAVLWSLPLFDASLFVPAPPVPPLAWGLALGREALLGGMLGFLFSLFLLPVRVAGEFLTQEIGLSFGTMMTTSGDGAASAPTVILELLAGLLFLGLDLHHVFLGVLGMTFTRYPVGQGIALPTYDAVTAVATAGEWGLLLAAPVGLCLFLTSVVLVLMTRAAPQLNLYSVGFPLRMVVGLGALLVFLPTLISGLVHALGRIADYLARMT